MADLNERRSLYDQGINDCDIAKRQGVSPQAVRIWRIKQGLPATIPQGRNGKADPMAAKGTAELKRRALALMERGVGSNAVARETGLSTGTVENWRTAMLRERPELRLPPRNGSRATPRYPSGRLYSKLRADRRAKAILLYADGLDDYQIAKELGLDHRQIWQWRKALFLPAIGRQYRNRAVRPKASRKPLSPAISPMSNPLYAHIAAAIGRNIAPDLVDDAVSEMWLAIAEGRITPDQVTAEARRYRNATLNTYASKFGPRSLDEDMSDGDNFRMIDLIRDERSSDWLEEMGATVW